MHQGSEEADMVFIIVFPLLFVVRVYTGDLRIPRSLHLLKNGRGCARSMDVPRCSSQTRYCSCSVLLSTSTARGYLEYGKVPTRASEWNQYLFKCYSVEVKLDSCPSVFLLSRVCWNSLQQAFRWRSPRALCSILSSTESFSNVGGCRGVITLISIRVVFFVTARVSGAFGLLVILSFSLRQRFS